MNSDLLLYWLLAVNFVVVGILTPVLTIRNARRTSKLAAHEFEFIRFKAVLAIVGWLPPTVFLLTSYVFTFQNTQPTFQDESLQLTVDQPSMHLTMFYIGFHAVYFIWCDVLIRFASHRKNALTPKPNWS